MQQVALRVAILLAAGLACAQARSIIGGATLSTQAADDASISGVIPSPNQEFYTDDILTGNSDIQRTSSSAAAVPKQTSAPNAIVEHTAQPSNEASIPVYISPFARAERPAASVAKFESSQESSHAPLNYAPRPSSNDLKTSASYGHGHHGGYHGGHHGYDHSGWLDMGAWTGGKGSFGWYADYPVGGKHHGYHGRRR